MVDDTTVRYAGMTWLRLPVAAIRVGVSVTTVQLWRRNGCPYLQGRKLASIQGPQPDDGGRRPWLVSEGQIDEIAACSLPEDEFEDDGGKWISTTLQKERYGFKPESLVRWHNDGCPALGGRKLRAVTRRARIRDGRPRSGIRFFHDADLERIRGERIRRRSVTTSETTAKRNIDEGRELREGNKTWISSTLAHERFGYAKKTLHKWHQNGCPRLDGRKLATRRQRGVSTRGWRWLYDQDDLQTIAERDRAAATEFIERAGVRYLRYDVAATQLGVSIQVMRKWRREGCPLVASRTVSWVRSTVLIGGRAGGTRTYNYWFIRDQDVAFIQKALTRFEDTLQEFEDAAGSWLSQRTAQQRYGFGLDDLRVWSKHGCSALGRHLPTRRCAAPLGVHRGSHLRIFYPKSDLEQIAKAEGLTEAVIDGSGAIPETSVTNHRSGTRVSSRRRGGQTKTERDIAFAREYSEGLNAGDWSSKAEFARAKGMDRTTMTKAIERGEAALGSVN